MPPPAAATAEGRMMIRVMRMANHHPALARPPLKSARSSFSFLLHAERIIFIRTGSPVVWNRKCKHAKREGRKKISHLQQVYNSRLFSKFSFRDRGSNSVATGSTICSTIHPHLSLAHADGSGPIETARTCRFVQRSRSLSDGILNRDVMRRWDGGDDVVILAIYSSLHPCVVSNVRCAKAGCRLDGGLVAHALLYPLSPLSLFLSLVASPVCFLCGTLSSQRTDRY